GWRLRLGGPGAIPSHAYLRSNRLLPAAEPTPAETARSGGIRPVASSGPAEETRTRTSRVRLAADPKPAVVGRRCVIVSRAGGRLAKTDALSQAIRAAPVPDSPPRGDCFCLPRLARFAVGRAGAGLC